MSPDLVTLVVSLATLAVAAVLARFARRSSVPGAAVIGGACAGILLGPTLAGRLAPSTFESWVAGGIEARETLRRTLGRHGAEQAAASAGSLAPEARIELEARWQEEEADARAAWRAAQHAHQRVPFMILGAGAALLLLAGGTERGGAPREAGGWPGRLTLAAWAVLVPGGVTYVACARLLDTSVAIALVAAAALAIGPWRLSEADRATADRVEPGGAARLRAAARLSSAGAAAFAIIGLALASPPLGLPQIAAVLALPVGWCAAGAVARLRALQPGPAETFVIPGVTALLMQRVDVIEHANLWLLVVVVLASGDGRWLGAFLGTWLTGIRDWLHGLGFALGFMNAAPHQLALAALGATLLEWPPALTLALVAGAVVVELAGPARRSLVVQLELARDPLE